MLAYFPFSYYPSIVYPKSQLFRLKRNVSAFILLLLSMNQVQASNAAELYGVDVLVADESTSIRQQAFTRGMNEVFIRISGDSIVMDKLKRPPSSRYVKQFSYDPVAKPTKNARGKILSHRLKIQYNGSLMEKYLRDNGFAVWGEHRSDVVVWLVVRDGKNEYVMKDKDTSLIKSAVETALARRGIPETWPRYDAKDRKKVNIVDLRGGFQDQVISASKRYSRGPSLTASLSWNGRQWQSSWSLLMAAGNRHWSLVDTNYNKLINKAVDQAADAMGVVFAVQGVVNKQSLAAIQLSVQAVDSINTYRHVENYLSDLSAVELTKTIKVDGQNVLFELLLRSSEGDFLNLIKNDAVLIKAQAIKIEEEIAPTEAVSPKNVASDGENNSDDLSVNQQKQLPVYYYKFIN